MSGSSRRCVPAVLLAAQLAACATNPAPRGWLPNPREAQHQALGGWIELRYRSGELAAAIEGELIAVSDERIYVLTPAGLSEVPQAAVTRARLAAYRTAKGELAAWTGLGAVSTLSHGGYLLLTFPMWLVAGSLISAAEARAGLVSYPGTPLASFRIYARFPQGLPPDLDRAALGKLKDAGDKPARK